MINVDGGAVVDAVDLELISQLEQDGRISFVQLGRLIGLSSEATRLRYLRLVEHGIVSVIGVVHPAHAGLRTVAGLSLTVYGHLDEVTANLQDRRAVTFLAWTRGDYNVTAEVACTDGDALTHLVYDDIATLPGVTGVRVHDFLRMYKWQTGIRIAPLTHGMGTGDSPVLGPESLTKADSALIRLLREDGRRSFQDLADEIGQPYGVVRRRCLSLIESGIVQIAVVVDRVLLERSAMAAVHLSLSGDVDAAFREIAKLPGVEILFRTSGWFQGSAELTGSSEGEILDLVDQHVCRVPGVRSASVHMYTAIKKLPSQWRFED